jgi:hypothetical protein
MLGKDAPVLADHDTIGIGVDFDRPPDRAGRDRVLLLSKRAHAG